MRDIGAVTALFDSALQVNKEKRKFARIPMQGKVVMVQGDRTIEGELVNLSLSGALVVSDTLMEIGSSLIITILDANASRKLSDLKAKVVRIAGNGMGLQFE
jgi:hypothetical protein